MKLYWSNQSFHKKHGDSDSQSARLYYREFIKAGITAKDLEWIADNLGRLENPKFIAHVSELIDLVKQRDKKECRIQLGPQAEKPLSLTKKNKLRQRTARMRIDEINKMRATLRGTIAT